MYFAKKMQLEMQTDYFPNNKTIMVRYQWYWLQGRVQKWINASWRDAKVFIPLN